MDTAKFVAAARSMIGTPFRHQGRGRTDGLDCAGLAVIAAQDCGYDVMDVRGYSRTPGAGRLVGAVLRHCDQIAPADVRPGDLMLFAFRGEIQHIGIVTRIDPVYIVHSYQAAHCVTEHVLDAKWQARARGCYRIRGAV